ncbi:uncharacterized protein LOC117644684 [Thrips palmi]|uniref:Uncharacterized protein LOC117644684 n=1 Tax=Thrips palmi TaxID=161013 RepID=A0A6P8YSX1_THRPL|nr:uncharacterized protein LOC117644684 [Thrips palmi]
MLLALPPRNVDFDDEAEMRRVFALAYDVFRYKIVLQQALGDCRFFDQFPQHAADPARAWLLLFDLHKRQFRPREAMELHMPPPPGGFVPGMSRQALVSAGLAEMDDDLWEMRVHLAAALARLRVKRRALRLSQLLPPHLQDGRIVNHEDALVTGWVNTFRSSKQQVCAGLERQGLRLVDDGPAGRARTVDAAREGAASVSHEDFRFDPVVPNVIVCHPEQRDDLAQAAIVRKCYLVLQDRAFCFGPAMVSKLLSDYDLTGCVAQTHIHSPRSTAYLAAILADNVKVDTLLAFGAGPRKQQYKAYFRKLGVTNAEVFEERFLDAAAHDGGLLDNVVAVLATPPNSYSAVTDPVDLVCSRGGDLAMLHQLTEPEGPGGGGGGAGSGMLQEQAATLRLAMAKPQVQFVVYETHSVYSVENERLVRRLAEQNLPGVAKSNQNQGEKRAKQPKAKEADKDDADNPAAKKKRKSGKQASKEPSAAATPAATAPATPAPTADATAPENPEAADAPADTAATTAGEAPQGEATSTEGSAPPAVGTEASPSTEQQGDEKQPTDAGKAEEAMVRVAQASHLMAVTLGVLVSRLALQVPACDLFEIGHLPDMCPHSDSCLSMGEEGCFLALIKRKEIVRMDANYMIKMAEARGLFGCAPGVRRYIAAMRAGSAAGWQYLLRLGPMLGPMLGPDSGSGSKGIFRLSRSAPAGPAPEQPLCSLHRHPFPLRVCLLEL